MAYSYIQQKGATGSNGVTTWSTGNTTSSITAGSTLIGIVQFDNQGGTPTVTVDDSAGTNDTWTQCGTDIVHGNFRLRAYRLMNAASGTLNFTATSTGGSVNWPAIAVYEFSGLSTYDQYQGRLQSAPGLTAGDLRSTAVSSALGGQPALVFGFAVTFDGSASPVAYTTAVNGTSFTDLGTDWGAGSNCAEHKRVTVTTAEEARFTAVNPGGSDNYGCLVLTFLEGGDSTAPVLSSPTGSATAPTTATIGATTDEGNGTIYGVVTTSATGPSVAQIKAGQDHTGSTAAWSGSAAVSSTGAKTLNATGLSMATTYYGHLVHTDAATNNSNVVSSSSFTTTGNYLKILVHSSAQSASSIEGIVFAAPTGGNITGTEIGEFTGKSFSGSLENGKAVLKVLTTAFGGGSLTTSDTPVVLVRNGSNTTGVIYATIIQE